MHKLDMDYPFPIVSITANYVRDLDLMDTDEPLTDADYTLVASAAAHAAISDLPSGLVETIDDAVDAEIRARLKAFRAAPGVRALYQHENTIHGNA